MAELFQQNAVGVKQEKSSYWLSKCPGGLDIYVHRLEIVLRSLLINRYVFLTDRQMKEKKETYL